MPRHRKRPKRYEIGEGVGDAVEDVETRYRVVYFEALDLFIKYRFQLSGYQIYSKLEELLVKSANKQDTTEELEFICRFYGDDLHADVLKMQLEILATNLPEEASGHNLKSVLAYLTDLSEGKKLFMSEV